MSPVELAKVIDFLEDAWPGTRNFRHAEKLAHAFGGLPARAVWEAANNHFNAGNKHAPTISELKESAAMIARGQAGLEVDRANCDSRGHHSRNWAITDIDKTDDKGQRLREAMCVDCGATVIRPAGQLLTVGEKALQDATAAMPQDPLGDRIAP